jgi:5'-nucleotidase
MRFHGRRAGAVSVAALASLALGIGSVAGSSATVAKPKAPDAKSVYAHLAKSKGKGHGKELVKLDLLALNDFHGNLESIPSSSSSGRINSTPAGGAAYLGAMLDNERAKSRAAGATPITVAAGDLIGASPLLSAAFHDEPTIEAMNQIGLQVASVGNHEFDEGVTELQRMQNGGCLDDGEGQNGADSCPKGKDFKGADFQYLSANVKWNEPSKHGRDTVFPATKIMKVHGQKVAFIGMTLEDTPTIVSQAGIQDVNFTDEVETANALVPQLKKRGVKSIVVLLHEGVAPTDSAAAVAYNDCSGLAGPGFAIAENLSPAIDAVVSGHTHSPYNCVVSDPKGNPRLLTSASSFGRMVTKLHFLIDPKTHDIVRPAAFASNMIVKNGEGEATDQGILDLIAKYSEFVKPIANEVIGHLDGTDKLSRTPDANGGDSPLGNLIADSQKEFDAIVKDGQAPVIAFMNPGGIRADLLENADGDVTYGAAFTVQPFNNFVASFDLTGAQIRALLNEQWNGKNEGTGQKILQVSGLSYTWDKSLAASTDPNVDAVVGDILVDDDGDDATPMVPLEDGTTYRVAANNFIADGGDNFGTFKAATNRVTQGLDIDALREYLQEHDPVAPTTTDRISSVD